MKTFFGQPALQLQPDAAGHGDIEESHFVMPFSVPQPLKWRLVISESNAFRKVWNVILAVLLVYIGTVFPFKLCFIDFKIVPTDSAGEVKKENAGWVGFEFAVDVLFVVDLLLGFFFTYTTHGIEVDSMPLIAQHYLRTFFFPNLIACLPAEAMSPVFSLFVDDGGGRQSSAHKITRMTRLQRITRLTRLIRVTRMSKIPSLLMANPIFRHLRGMRGMRIVNFAGVLFWAVHLLACGWYLCAALHNEPEETWVGNRVVDTSGARLMSRSSGDQWWHSMYFVLTVFTTVGFGDISASTSGEIAYACFVMLVGAIVHSVIVSEIITIVTSIDHAQVEASRRKDLISGFAKHTDLNDIVQLELHGWINHQAERGKLDTYYDREAMRELLSNGSMPTDLLRLLPENIFGGRLLRSEFLQVCLHRMRELPPRLAVLVALEADKREYSMGEVVYMKDDAPFNLYLVFSGTFAYIGTPGHAGGEDASPNPESGNPALSTAKVAIRALSERVGRVASDESFNATGVSRLKLYPYQLFNAGSYFGDLELLASESRLCTARCESDGSLLVMHRQQYFRLHQEFPRCRDVWLSAARRREVNRQLRLARLRKPRNFQAYAALTIQSVYKVRRNTGSVHSHSRLVWRRPSLGCQPSPPTRTSPPLVQPKRTGSESFIVQEEQEHTPSSVSRHVGACCSGNCHHMNVELKLQNQLRAGLEELRQELRAGLEQLRHVQTAPKRQHPERRASAPPRVDSAEGEHSHERLRGFRGRSTSCSRSPLPQHAIGRYGPRAAGLALTSSTGSRSFTMMAPGPPDLRCVSYDALQSCEGSPFHALPAETVMGCE